MDAELLRRAHDRLMRTQGLDELEEVLDQEPVLHAPEFHALLLRANETGALDPVRYAHEVLFFLLHKRAHRQGAAACAQETRAARIPSPVHAPAYFLQLAEQIGGRLPPPRDTALSPALDAERIQQDVSDLLGTEAVLPLYEPTLGTSWCAVVVACAACGTERLELRAQFIDLTVAPSLLEPLRAGHLHSARCDCGCPASIPRHIWLHEGPLPHDVLQALCCLWVLGEHVLVLELPPGTPQEPRLKDVYIGRMQHLARRMGLLERGDASSSEKGDGVDSLFMVLAFGQDALLSELEEQGGGPEHGEHLFDVTLEFLTRHLEQETCSFDEVVSMANTLVRERGRTWKASLPRSNHDEGGRPLRHVALTLISEALGREQGAPLRAQAFLAANTARALLATGRRGLAETALTRADDLMAQVDPAEEGAALIQGFLRDSRADLLRHAKRYGEARALASVPQPPASDAPLDERLHYQQLLGRQALDLKRDEQYLQAIEAFPSCVEGFEALEAEARASQVPAVQDLLPSIRSSLSGALANWSSAHVEWADELEAAASGGDASGSGPPPGVEAPTPAQLRARALPLLARALDISTGEQNLRFAAIQARRMGILQLKLGDFAEGRAWMQRTCEFAEAAGRFDDLWRASEMLARFSLREADGAAVLGHAERAARALLRLLVAEGQNVVEPEALRLISGHALRAAEADLSADAARAIMVAESLKSVRTSLGLRREMPGRLADPADEPIQALLRQRERLATQLDIVDKEETPPILVDLSEVHARLEEARRERGLRNPVYARWCDVTDVYLSDVTGLRARLAKLGPRTTLLGVYPTGGDGLWLYVLWAEGAQVVHVPWKGWPGQLVEMLVAIQGDPGPTQEVLGLLAEKLVLPVRERLEGLSRDDRLIISAESFLHVIPFAALPLHGEPLCARMTLSQIQGLGVLEACAEAPHVPLRSVLCVGVPSRPGLRPLYHARFEVLDIERTVQETRGLATVLLGEEATVPNVLMRAHAHDALHLACHATWRPPEPPRLALQPDHATGDSGDLTDVRILWELKLKPGALVILSACQSAYQTEGGGELSEGLVPAMLIAGARAVIASLWEINDKRSRCFQCTLYQKLLSGLPPARALVETQRACLSGELGEEMTRFDIWAAFVLFGFH